MPESFSGADGALSGGSAWAAADYSFTRPNNTTATVANGAIGGVSSAPGGATVCGWTFSNFFDFAGQKGALLALKMSISASGIAVPASIAIRVHLYQDDESGTVLSSVADAATFMTKIAADAKKLGYVDFNSFVIGGAGSDCIESYGIPVLSPALPIKALAGSKAMFAIPVASAIWTPVASSAHYLYGFRAGF